MPACTDIDGNQRFEGLVATLKEEVVKPKPTRKLSACVEEILELSHSAETEALRRKYASVVDSLRSESEAILRANGVSLVS